MAGGKAATLQLSLRFCLNYVPSGLQGPWALTCMQRWCKLLSSMIETEKGHKSCLPRWLRSCAACAANVYPFYT